MITIPQATQVVSHRTAQGCRQGRVARGGADNFAVGISSQPLPNGRYFASHTYTGAPGISATDASTCQRFDLPILRPETVEPFPVKLPPTATNFYLSTAAGTRVGRKKITNGVKQQMFSARSCGVEIFPEPAHG